MEDERFNKLDIWLAGTLRYHAQMPLSLDELLRRAYGHRKPSCCFPILEKDLLWVAFLSRKKERGCTGVFRYSVERNETGVFVGLNPASEVLHLRKRKRQQGGESDREAGACGGASDVLS